MTAQNYGDGATASDTYLQVKQLMAGVVYKHNQTNPIQSNLIQSNQSAQKVENDQNNIVLETQATAQLPSQIERGERSERFFGHRRGRGIDGSPDKRQLDSQLVYPDYRQSPDRPDNFDQILAAQALVQDHEISMRREANTHQSELDLLQANQEQEILGQYAATYRDNQITSEDLKRKSGAIEKQLALLYDKMRDIQAQIQQKPHKRVIRKKCDHVPTLDQLDSDLKTRESEFKANHSQLNKSLREKEGQLASTISAIKQTRNQTELLRRQKVNTESSSIGYEKMNELVAKLRELQGKQESLKTDVKSYQRINSDQNKELETIDAVKNYQGKVQSYTRELREVNQANRDLAEQIGEVAKTRKQLRAQEVRLEDKQRDVLTRQRLINASSNTTSRNGSRSHSGANTAASNPIDNHDPYARRKRELAKLSQAQLKQMIANLEAANEERSKINQKYADQVKSSRQAATGLSSVYDSAARLPTKNTIIGSGLKNYPSARALSNRGRNQTIESSYD